MRGRVRRFVVCCGIAILLETAAVIGLAAQVRIVYQTNERLLLALKEANSMIAALRAKQVVAPNPSEQSDL